MTGVGGAPKNFEAFIVWTKKKIIALERRSTGGVPPGVPLPFFGTTAPGGYAICDGAEVSRADNPRLFAAIGTAWGVGNGSTTFNLPNLKGRVLVGRDPGQAEFDTIGETGGTKTHTLTIAEMPAHSHQWVAAGTNAPASAANWDDIVGANQSPIGAGPAAPEAGNAIQPRGGGGAHNNLQPYAVGNYIIALG